MGKRLLSILLTLLLLLLGLPLTATAATATTVTLSVPVAAAGEPVTASGVSDADTWIAVKVLDSVGSIVVLDFVKSGVDGSYSCTFIVPPVADGILRVIAGYGSNVAKAELTVGAAPTAVELQSAAADSTTGTTVSTRIDLVFDKAITGLTADNITITNGTGAAVKGALTGSGTSWSIALTSVTAQGDVSVAVTAPTGYILTGSPKTVMVYKAAEIVNSTISPTTKVFDLDNPAAVSTNIAWGSAQTVTDVVYGTTPAAYTLIGSTLTISEAWLTGLNLSDGDTVELAISFDEGSNAALTVEALRNHTKGSDASLDGLTVGGSTVSGFVSNQYVYNVELPYGTQPGSAAALIGAIPVDPKALTVITQAANLPGDASVSVTSEDGNTKQPYTIHFTLGAEPNTAPNRKAGVPAVTSASIMVNTPYTLNLSTIFEDADGDTLNYKVSVSDAVYASANLNYTYTPVSAGQTMLVFKANDGTADSADTYTVMLTASNAPTYALTITAGTGGSITTGSSGNYAAGAVINITATASANYSFNRWMSVGGGTFANANNSSTSFTMPAGAAALTAGFTYNGGGSGSDGGGNSTPSTPAVPKPAYNANVLVNGAESTLSVTVNTNAGSAAVDVSTRQGNGFSNGGTIVITMPSIPGVDKYTLGIPAAYLSSLDSGGTLTLNTDTGSVTLPANMLADVTGAEGKKAEIAIGQCDKSGLPEAAKAAIGDRPLIQLAVTIDGKQTEWNNPDAPVTISIPYAPIAAELANPESIVIWYIDGSGKMVSVPNGHYDPNTGTVTFVTTHFSYYAVGYYKMSFNDVAVGAWYNKAVGFIAARGITTGTGNGNYSPEAKLTRGQFIVMLMKAYDVASDVNPEDNFADAGNTWYTGYLAAAKRLDISGGVGNNMFEPGKEITRQEMFTLLYNALKVIGSLPKGTYGKALSDFSDANEIASWAKDAMTLMVGTGTISGNGGKLSPASTTTRAEMAQVLYNLLSK